MPLGDVDEATATIQLRVRPGRADDRSVGHRLSLVVSREISRPLEEMRKAAERFARGELGYKLLRARIGRTGRPGRSAQSNGRAACKSASAPSCGKTTSSRPCWPAWSKACWRSTTEQRIISLNKAAGRAAGHRPAPGAGPAAARSGAQRRPAPLHHPRPDLQRADRRRRRAARRSRSACCRPAARRCTTPQAAAIGAVIVLNDVTDFRRLETHSPRLRGQRLARAENAHHVDQRFCRNAARRRDARIPTTPSAFLHDHRQAGRPTERDHRRPAEPVEDRAKRRHRPTSCCSRRRVADVLESAVRTTARPSADERQIDGPCSPATTTVMAQINRQLLEQAVVNLLDNAIKYSEPGGEVQVLGSRNRAAKSRSPSRDQGWASRPSICRASSSDSIASTRPAAASWAAPVWGWRSSSTSCRHQGPCDGGKRAGSGSTFTIHLPLAAQPAIAGDAGRKRGMERAPKSRGMAGRRRRSVSVDKRSAWNGGRRGLWLRRSRWPGRNHFFTPSKASRIRTSSPTGPSRPNFMPNSLRLMAKPPSKPL